MTAEAGPPFHGALAAFLDAAPDAIVVVDLEGKILAVNRLTSRLFGYEPEELIGSRVEMLVPERARGAHVRERSAFSASPKTRPMGEGLELSGRRKDGTEFPVEISLSPLELEKEKVVVSIVRDIGGRLEAERRRALAEAHAERERMRALNAEEAVRHRDEFLAIASHELRTPLTALQLQLRSLDSRLAGLDAKASAKLERVTRSAERLTALVDSLLDVSRISGGGLHVQPVPLVLEDVLREAAERHRSQAAEAGCDLRLDLEAGLEGEWDRTRLEQVVTNLLSNAFKYGGGRPVEIRARSAGGDVEIAVTDHGAGVAPEDAERIFERFERASPVQHYGGLGLGLYISRQIVRAHGGTIRVERPPEGGARFVVRLPRSGAGSRETGAARETTA